MDPSFGSLTRAVEAVRDATDTQDALERLVGALHNEFELWSASIFEFVSADAVRALAAWSTADTVVTVGMDISVHFTEDTRTTAATLLRGYPVAFRADDVDFGILSDVMTQDGAGSVAVVPLHAGDVVGAILALTSATSTAFEPDTVPFLTGLGRGIETTVMDLVRRGRAESANGTGPKGPR